MGRMTKTGVACEDSGAGGGGAGNVASVVAGPGIDVDATDPDNPSVSIGTGEVTLAMMANLAQDQFIVRTTASTGVPQTATCTAAARSILDDTTTGAICTTLGLGTGDSPQFTAINLGHASDTTITRTGAGDIAVEGKGIYRADGTDVAIADGGTGASTAVGARTALRQHTDNDLTDAATIAVNAALGEHFNVTLTDNRTLGNPSNAPAAGLTQMLVISVKQDGTGSRTLAYDTKYRFSTDIPSPTLTTTASKKDILTFKYDADADKWDLVAIVKGF